MKHGRTSRRFPSESNDQNRGEGTSHKLSPFYRNQVPRRPTLRVRRTRVLAASMTPTGHLRALFPTTNPCRHPKPPPPNPPLSATPASGAVDDLDRIIETSPTDRIGAGVIAAAGPNLGGGGLGAAIGAALRILALLQARLMHVPYPPRGLERRA